MTTKARWTFPMSRMLGILMALNACGTTTSTGGFIGTPAATVAATTGATPVGTQLPDRVRIATDEPIAPLLGATLAIPGGTPSSVTLSDLALVRQLYATIYALPEPPTQRACTLERGPHYTLTFLQGTASFVTIEADRDGCWPVTIAGKTPIREASTTFWQQLDQAIISATPPLSPDRVAIATAPRVGQAPQSAMITSAATAKQLYDAILALPRTSGSPNCTVRPVPNYQLVFFAGDHAVPASVDDTCHTVEVDGGYQWRGGRFAANDQFQRMLQAVLSGVTFGSAQPDQLAAAVNTRQTAIPYVMVSDPQFMFALFDQVFQLSETGTQPNCPPVDDKLAGKGTFTTLAFMQWGLPLVRIDTYQGSCRYVQMSDTGPRLQGTQSFWDLIDRLQAP